jgi:uncharacterized protein YjbI with pentapeptide repeats
VKDDQIEQQRRQRQIEGIGQRALDLVGEANDLEKISKGLKAAKISAEATKAHSPADKIQFWAATVAPLATILIALVTIFFQYRQFLETSEDTQWREAMKGVSFEDPSHAITGAMAMLGFFDSKPHTKLARSITVSLMPMIDNVGAFDDVMTSLDNHTDEGNQGDIIGIAQKLSAIEWQRLKESPQENSYAIPFVQKNVLAVDFLKPRDKRNAAENLSIVAWEVDTTSHALYAIWQRDRKARPSKPNLTDVVMENYDFSEVDPKLGLRLDFSGASLQNAVLANARFEGAIFRRADFEKAHLITSYRLSASEQPRFDTCLNGAGKTRLDTGVCLNGADLCEVTSFEGSDWSGANWWTAGCISPDLYNYLKSHFLPVAAADRERAIGFVPQ